MPLNVSKWFQTTKVSEKSYFHILTLQEAVHFLNKSVQLLSENGNFSTAARLIKDIAELFEREASFKDAAIQYEKAADMFNTEDVKSYILKSFFY